MLYTAKLHDASALLLQLGLMARSLSCNLLTWGGDPRTHTQSLRGLRDCPVAWEGLLGTAPSLPTLLLMVLLSCSGVVKPVQRLDTLALRRRAPGRRLRQASSGKGIKSRHVLLLGLAGCRGMGPRGVVLGVLLRGRWRGSKSCLSSCCSSRASRCLSSTRRGRRPRSSSRHGRGCLRLGWWFHTVMLTLRHAWMAVNWWFDAVMLSLGGMWMAVSSGHSVVMW